MNKLIEGRGINKALFSYMKMTNKADASYEDFCEKGFNPKVDGVPIHSKAQFRAAIVYFTKHPDPRFKYKDEIEAESNNETNPAPETSEKEPAKKTTRTRKTKEEPKEDYQYKEIDGFKVGYDKPFNELSVSYLQKRYDEFNKKYFDDKLPKIKLIINNTKTALGMCRSWRRKTEYRPVRTIQISISTFLLRTELSYCHTLLHEMIHCYEADVLDASPGHGWNFKRKMNEINRYGWEVSTKSSSLDGVNAIANEKNVDKNCDDYLLVTPFNGYSSLQLFKCYIPKKNVSLAARVLKSRNEAKLYKIINNAPFIGLKKCMRAISGDYTSKEEIQKYIDTGYLKEDTSLDTSSITSSAAKELAYNNYLYVTVFNRRTFCKCLVNKMNLSQIRLSHLSGDLYQIIDGSEFIDMKSGRRSLAGYKSNRDEIRRLEMAGKIEYKCSYDINGSQSTNRVYENKENIFKDILNEANSYNSMKSEIDEIEKDPTRNLVQIDYDDDNYIVDIM